MKHDRMSVLAGIVEQGVVPVFYHPDVEVCLKVIQACGNGGAKCVEFTNRGDFAASAFLDVARHFAKADPSIVMGVGSVVDAPTAGLYIANGAKFVVGPVLNADVAKVCNRRKIPYSPGCGSASEISYAEELGCEIVKIFPGSSVGGPDFVKAILGPMPWTKMMPTGGVEATEESLESWFGAGIVAAGIGSNLITKKLLEAKDYAGIEARVRETVATDQIDPRESSMSARILPLRSASECKWDCVSLGEVMLRFDPGFGRVRNRAPVHGVGRRRRIQCGARDAQMLGKTRLRRHSASGERSGLAGGGFHLPGRGGHLAHHLARLRRHWPQHPRRSQLHREGLRHPRRAGLLGPRQFRGLADQAGRSELGEAVRRRRRALVPHRRNIRGTRAKHSRNCDRSGRGGAQTWHRCVLRSQLPRVAVEEPGRQGRRAKNQPRHRQTCRCDDRQ